MIVRYRARALADIDDIFHYLAERSPAGARNVVRAIRSGIQIIAEQPYSSPETDMTQVRVKIVRRYRYKIFYRLLNEDIIEILHIRHTARKPWP